MTKIIPAQGGGIVPLSPGLGRAQALYDRQAKMYASEGVITTPGFLLLAVPLTGGTSAIQFNTLENAGSTKLIIERRLKLNDTFTVTGIAYYTGLTSGVTDALITQMKMYSYPDPVAFTAGVANAYEAIYNSFLSLRIDTNVFIDSLTMRTFYRVGQAQQGVGDGVVTSRNEWPVAMFGRNEMTPTVELNGTATIEWNINIPTNTTLTPADGTSLFAILYLTGFLNQGAATVQRKIQDRLKSSSAGAVAQRMKTARRG